MSKNNKAKQASKKELENLGINRPGSDGKPFRFNNGTVIFAKNLTEAQEKFEKTKETFEDL